MITQYPGLIHGLTEPARRHRCEACRQVFECHVCEIGNSHRMHSAERIAQLEDPTVLVFVCEECASRDDLRFSPVRRARPHPLWWDYVTGDKVSHAAMTRLRRRERTIVH